MSPTSTDRIVVDRFTAPRTDPDDPGWAHRATARDAGPDRARGLCGRVERTDRPVAGDLRGHRPQVASPMVRGTGCGVAGRCEAIGSPTEVHRCPSRPGQGDGLHTTPGQRFTAVAVVVPGAGRTGDHRRDLRVDIAGDHPPVAVRGRAQTVAVPVVDLHHRPRLCRQGATRARPLRPHVGRQTVGPQRLCDLRRREDLHPGPLPLPPHPACRQGPPDPGQP